MSASPSTVLNPAVSPLSAAHAHALAESCPTCDQPIPPDRAEEITQRIRARQDARDAATVARLQHAFVQEKTRAVDAARQEGSAALERERQDGAVRLGAARDQARQEAETAAEARIVAVQRAHRDEKLAADVRLSSLQAQLNQIREDAAANEARIRAEARQTAESEASEKISNLQHKQQLSEAAFQRRIQEAEAAKTTAEQNGSALASRLEQLERDSAATIEALRQDTETRENAAREQGTAAATAAMQQQIAQAEKDKVAAEARAGAADADRASLSGQLQAEKDGRGAEIARAVQETRDALEKDKTAAVNAEQAKHLTENQRLTGMVDDLKLQLERKTSEELGEGAELDLYEQLKTQFETDLIRRVPHGHSGADIIHEIREDNVVCGKIVYDSKNRKDWKYEYTTKLRTDKIAEEADHAVLSTNKFPAGTRQLHIHDGVVIACPARVLVVAQMLREQVVLLHAARASMKAREEKTHELYEFMTAVQSAELFDTVNAQITKLEKIDEDEVRAHKVVWNRRGKEIKALEKAHGTLRYQVRRITGALDNEPSLE